MWGERLFKAEQGIARSGPKRHQTGICVDSSKQTYRNDMFLDGFTKASNCEGIQSTRLSLHDSVITEKAKDMTM